MLELGGNAFDAGVAAGFAAVVTEPALTSLGGGGFFLAHSAHEKKDTLFDFFVNTPGLGLSDTGSPAMQPVAIEFPGCTQVFHTGYASVAVPGTLKGLLHIHKKLCTLPLQRILRPAISMLEAGVPVNGRQEIFLRLLRPIMTASSYGREIYVQSGRYAQKDDLLFNPLLREFLSSLATDGADFYHGAAAEGLAAEMRQHGGLLTKNDLQAYEVIEREPLCIRYRDRDVLTNPAPSLGGIKLALTLRLLEQIDIARTRRSEDFFITLAEVMKEMYSFHPLQDGQPLQYPFPDDFMKQLVASFRESVAGKTSISQQGTTHISVIDEAGNAVSMTTSNGSCSGCYIPGTGIMLNNMMGEDDLHPGGFFSSPAGSRVSSMMLPTLIMKDGSVESALGSGGSKRIRTAVLQCIVNLIDLSLPVEDAVEKARIHFEDGVLHTEPGVPDAIIKVLGKYFSVHPWDAKDMYFGGVHCVTGSMQGWGDSRRGGSFVPVRKPHKFIGFHGPLLPLFCSFIRNFYTLILS